MRTEPGCLTLIEIIRPAPFQLLVSLILLPLSFSYLANSPTEASFERFSFLRVLIVVKVPRGGLNTFRGVLEAAVSDGTDDLGLEEEVAETGTVNADIRASVKKTGHA